VCHSDKNGANPNAASPLENVDVKLSSPVHARRRYFDSLEPEQRLVLRTVALRQVELMCILKGAFGRVERRTSTRESRSNCS
jgi:hypothetical protein